MREIASGPDVRRTSLNMSIEKELENDSVKSFDYGTEKKQPRMDSKKLNVKSILSQSKNE